LANIYSGQGEIFDAEHWYQEAISIQESALGSDHPELADTYACLAEMKTNFDPEGAEYYYQAALEIQEEKLPEGHAATMGTYDKLAGLYLSLAQYEEALQLYMKMAEITKRNSLWGPSEIATIYCRIGSVYYNQDDFSGALKWQKEALKALGKLKTELAAEIYYLMANSYVGLNNFAEAFAWFQYALKLQEVTIGLKHPDIARTYTGIANAHCLIEQYNKGLIWYLKALEIREKALGVENQETLETYRSIAYTYAALGENEKAEKYTELSSALDME
jgi:tetratricopeptide (TPR) repeat protein